MKHVATISVCLAFTGCTAAHDSIDEQLAMLDRLRAAECARALACVTSPLGSALVLDACGSDDWGWRAAIVANRAHVDLAAASACLDGLASVADCVVRADSQTVPARPWERACQSALRVDARACGTMTCDPASACVPQSDCTFACVRGPAVGEPCDRICAADSSCVAGVCRTAPPIECRGRVSESFSIGAGHCYRPVGAECTTGGCVPGGYCARASMTCVTEPPPLPLGAACDPSSDPPCAYPFDCSASSRTCVAMAAVGEACVDRAQCAPGSYCSIDGVCTTTIEGSRCETLSLDVSFIDDCPDGYLCGPDRRCRVVATLGQACDDATTPCAPGTRCASGVCARVVAQGAPCGAATPCAPYLQCVDGTCVYGAPLGTVTAPCRPDGSCRQGTCVDGSCAWLPIGAACPVSMLCPNCIAGICQAPAILSIRDACTYGDRARVCGDGLTCTYGSPSIAPAFCCPAQ